LIASLGVGDLRDTMLYASDLLELNGEDLRSLPLGDRKVKLARLLRRAPAGIVYNEHTDEDGAVAFRHACKLGFEGIVSKRLGAPYRSGPSRGWIKVKNPDSPAMIRARDHFALVGNDLPPLPAAMPNDPASRAHQQTSDRRSGSSCGRIDAQRTNQICRYRP
jgi:hypothetical protein